MIREFYGNIFSIPGPGAQQEGDHNYQKSIKNQPKLSKINQNNQKLTQKLKNGGFRHAAAPRPPSAAPIFEFLGRFLIVLIDF